MKLIYSFFRFFFTNRSFLFPKNRFSFGTSKEIGDFGENHAVRFLKKKNYKIVKRNWRFKRCELDIIAVDGEVLVFIEVKTRSDSSFIRGYQAVDKRKRKLLAQACRAYLNHLSYRPYMYRVDIIDIVVIEQSKLNISHYENIGIID